MIGAITVACTRRRLPVRLLAGVLAAAVFLVPAEQARIHVYTSLFKHVGFWGWFAAIVAGSHGRPSQVQFGAKAAAARWTAWCPSA